MISSDETSPKIKLLPSEKSLNNVSGENEIPTPKNDGSRKSIIMQSFLNQKEASKTGIDKIIVISENEDDEKVFEENIDMSTLVRERIHEFGYSPRKFLLDNETTWVKKNPSLTNSKNNLRSN